MPDPKEQIIEAFADQGNAEWQYAGTDSWEIKHLAKNNKIAQIEWRDIDHPDNGKPYSRYFTDASEIEKLTGPDGKVDMQALSERLQVNAHGGNYNASVSIYEVTDDLKVPISKTLDNPALGKGGANQYFLPEDVKAGQYLEKVDHIEGVNRTTKMPIFDELKGLDPDDDARTITRIVKAYNDNYMDALRETGHPKAIEVADDMIERQAFSETARDIKGDPEAIKSAELPDAKATALDLDAKTLSQVERIRDESLGRNVDAPERSGMPDNSTPSRTPTALDDATRMNATTRITSADELGELRGFAATPDGITSHLIDTKTSTIYTITGDDLTGVQKFDNSKEAGHAFGRLIGDAAQAHPDAFKGLPQVHNSLGSLGNHIDDLGRPAWRKALGAFGEGAAEFGGKASKILGPLGVAAAGAEAYGLEMKLRDYEEFGLVPEEAMLAYRANLTAHTAQATVDPTLVGGEVVIQAAHDQWAKAYGISDDVKEALEPGSLLEDVHDATLWLEAQAAAAGMAVKDYAVDRFNNPEKIGEDLERIGDAALRLGADVLETAGEAAEAVSDYASSRWEEPSRLLDDAEAVGGAIKEGAYGAWHYLFGEEEPSALESSLQNGHDAGASTQQTVPFSRAVEQFSDDREILRDIDPKSEWVETQLANHPEAEAMFVRLNDMGMTQFPQEALKGDTPQARIGTIMSQAREIDLDVTAEKTADRTFDKGVDNNILQEPQAASEEADYSYAM